MRMRTILACLLLLGTANFGLAAEAAYRCADGSTVRANFSDPGAVGSVRLTFAKTKIVTTLPQVLSADGGRYADASMEFWIKGRTARLTRSDNSVECKQR